MHGVEKKIKLVTEYALTEGLRTWNNIKKKQTNKQTKKQKWYTVTRTIIIPWDILFSYLQVKFSPEDNIKTLKDLKFET